MSAEVLINVSPREVRAVLVEEGVLQELYIERANKRGLISNIYKGRVSRVLPGMQAAFIDIGLERTAFLHASDIVTPSDAEHVEHLENNQKPERTADIQSLVAEGHEILVQVLKDPLGTKGARLTTFITIPSRYLVFMPKGRGVGVSSRIEDETERKRLRETMLAFVQPHDTGGYIVRTAAEGASPDALRTDMMFLQKMWQVLSEKTLYAKPGELVNADLPLQVRVLRDVVLGSISKVSIDHEESFQAMTEFARTFMPEMGDRIELFRGDRPIFDLYGIEEEIERSLDRKVPLKSGGYLMLDQTEAMTTIDVNTGAYVGHRTLEETIFRTNLEASVAIARQLRLRNLGGIIIIDFIDMDNDQHRGSVLAEFQKALAPDRTRMTINGFTSLGLVEMTRKRTRESLAHVLCEPCPMCHGRGELKTAQTICYEILRELVREARQFDAREFRVLASQKVIDTFLDEESQSLAMLEEFIGKPVRLQVENVYNQEQYDIVLV